ncbi:reverse transcriptase domain-containing protein [Tanacetum coccineum]|uniref:Reverse transcriptase domain-containing protein n=1 Tax=Tanacetum coccineum TaxID=301880 RepID=A0ABQ4WCV3_9ASTR
MEAQYVRINVPLVDVLAGMSNYGKFLKNSKAFSCNALADLGASINLVPYSLYAKLSLKTLKPTKMSVRLVVRSSQHPIGIAKNMLVKVGKFTFPVDFNILEMKEDSLEVDKAKIGVISKLPPPTNIKGIRSFL